MERRRLLIQVALVIGLTSFVLSPIEEASAQWEREVKFKGIVTSDEKFGVTVAYGSYYCKVSIEEILFDPNNTLSLSDIVTVCYPESLSLEIGEEIECFGLNCINCFSCPKQYVGKIVCKGNSYYTIQEFSSLNILLPLFIIATLLAVLLHRRKRAKSTS